MKNRTNTATLYFTFVKQRTPILLSCFGLLIFGLMGCDSSDSEPVDMTVASITIEPANDDLISLGQEVQLQVAAANAEGIEIPSGAVTWTTSDQSTLSITSTGLMIGEHTGNATITASAGGKQGELNF